MLQILPTTMSSPLTFLASLGAFGAACAGFVAWAATDSAGVGATSAAPQATSPIESLDFESAEIVAGLHLHDRKSDHTHEGNLKGFERERARSITWREQFEGQYSIAYEVDRTYGLGPATTSGLDYFGNGTDKVHHWIVPYQRQDALMKFGKTYYLGLAFKIDERSEVPVPGNGAIIFQVWQGAPFGPPLKVHLINVDGDFHLAVSGRNDLTGSNPRARWELIQAGAPVRPGHWHRCVVKATMRHHAMREPGEVEVWMAREREPLKQTASWRGPIGYDPAALGNYDGKTDVPHPRATLVPTFGVYRERQPRRLTLYFDNVKYATSFALADPLDRDVLLAAQ